MMEVEKRIIWQALQRYRGLPYNTAYCAVQSLKKPMRPFSESRNPNPLTARHSLPLDVFDYGDLNYRYDLLDFNGLTIPELETHIEKRKEQDRVFAAFLLKGIGISADVEFDICSKDKRCTFGGTFAILGGPYEMPWQFDRRFRYDITHAMNHLHLKHSDDFHFHVRIKAVNGSELNPHLIPDPTVTFTPGTHQETGADDHTGEHGDTVIRKDINSLSLDEANNLRNALIQVQADRSTSGYEDIAGFHGYPFKCPEGSDDQYACCVHGMPIFPHWHRLLTVQFERALINHGATIGIPFWDWTKPVTRLPMLFADSTNNNPFYKYHIRSKNADTTRDVNNIFNQQTFGDYNYIYYLTLSTLEEDNFCDFEVQFEVLHNAVHAWIGGTKEISMSTLEYSAFDPFFMIHHSSIDRVWRIWEELQKMRGKSSSGADCSGGMYTEPLHPFDYESQNAFQLTRTNSLPSAVADHRNFHYDYDSLHLHDKNLKELNAVIEGLRDNDRIFAGFVLSGIQTTAELEIRVRGDTTEEVRAGIFIILGGEREMPWAYERIFKYDITSVASDLGLTAESNFHFTLNLIKYNGERLANVEMKEPLIVHRAAHSRDDVVVIPIHTGANLPPKIVVKKGTKIEFQNSSDTANVMIDLRSYTAYSTCMVPPFAFNGYDANRVYELTPGDYYFTSRDANLCRENLRIQVHVEDE